MHPKRYTVKEELAMLDFATRRWIREQHHKGKSVNFLSRKYLVREYTIQRILNRQGRRKKDSTT